MKEYIVGFSKTKLILGIFDFFALALSVMLAVGITYDIPTMLSSPTFITATCAIFCYYFFYFLLGLTHVIWTYSRAKDYLKVLLVLILSYGLVMMVIIFREGFALRLLGAVINMGALSTALIMSIRFFRVVLYDYDKKKFNMAKSNLSDRKAKRTMIIGAGWTGNVLSREIINSPTKNELICIIDDDKAKLNRMLNDIKIVGNTTQIVDCAKKYNIETIILAIPSLSSSEQTRILNECVKTGCKTQIVPYTTEMIRQNNVLSKTRDIKVEDLLGRPQQVFDKAEVRAYINNKVCMVTGGGGSIGSEICRQIAMSKPKKLIILDIYENNAYEIQQELVRKYGDKLDMKVIISSIADYPKMRQVFEEEKPNIVFHAAAHKHVPLMETVPEEVVKNNIVGTYNIAKVADEFKVDKMVMISTDKAVNPTNVMGASKRCCEMIVKMFADKSKHTKYCMVRFGNVLGSNGSVIPLFKKQMEMGGPLTVTHKDIIRYFMTIPEAVSLVLQAGVLADSGEIFVLDMGEPVKIVTLAENMIKLSGLVPYKDMDIKFVGLRPGEKLFEELLLDEENTAKTKYDKIYIGKEPDVDAELFMKNYMQLVTNANNNDAEKVIEGLKTLIPTFNHKLNS